MYLCCFHGRNKKSWGRVDLPDGRVSSCHSCSDVGCGQGGFEGWVMAFGGGGRRAKGGNAGHSNLPFVGLHTYDIFFIHLSIQACELICPQKTCSHHCCVQKAPQLFKLCSEFPVILFHGLSKCLVLFFFDSTCASTFLH